MASMLREWIQKIRRVPPEVTRLLPPAKNSGYAPSFDGTLIYWERHGPEKIQPNKKPMLFCYGLVCSINQWRGQLERYSKEHACILFDYRGHHQSSRPVDKRSLNMSALARDAWAALEAQDDLKDQSVHIWAHSLGCNVALEFAVAFPERVATLNLCCGTLENPFRRMFHSDIMERLITPVLENLPRFPEALYNSWEILLARPELAKLVVPLAGFNKDATTPQDINTYIEAVASISPRTFFHLLRELTRESTQGIAAKVKQPVAVIAGAKDHITPVEAQKLMAEALPDATYVEIPAGSHNVQLDFAEYVCLRVEELWRSRNLW